MIGGLPRSREKGVSIWMAPSLEEGSQNSGLDLRGKEIIPGLHQTWCPLLAPPILVLDAIRIIQLIAFGLVSEDDNADAPSAQNTRDNRTDPISPTWTKINRVCGGLWEVNGLGPMQWKRENLFRDRPRDRGSGIPEIGPWKETELG